MHKKTNFFSLLLLPFLLATISIHAQTKEEHVRMNDQSRAQRQSSQPVLRYTLPSIEKELVAAFINKDVEGVLKHCAYPFSLAIVERKTVRDTTTLRKLLQAEMKKDYLNEFFKGKRSITGGSVIYYKTMSDKKDKSGVKPFLRLGLIQTKQGAEKLISLEVGD